MKPNHLLLSAALFLFPASLSVAQNTATPEKATSAVLRAFESHDIVMFGEIHGNKQEYEWLRSLVATPEFADRVDDIVVEFGNSLYQKSVDRYVSGEDVPLEQVQRAWRNLVGAIGPPSTVYASFYDVVRQSNMTRRGKHQMRIVCGDPYIDWEKVKSREDIAPYLGNRDTWYTQVVKDEVQSKHHRALLIMGWGHFLRGSQPFPTTIEPELRSAGAKTYLIVAGTNATADYEVLDHRFDSWHAPAIVSLDDNWVGDLPAFPVLSGGGSMPKVILKTASGTDAPATEPPPLKLKDVADALLYLGPRDGLTRLSMTRAELDSTAYGKEMERRLTIEFGTASGFISDNAEAPQFSKPQPGSSLPPLPPPPRNMGASLPPRPASQ